MPRRLETLESVQCDGYRREKLVFDSEALMSVPAYLLVPDGRREPGAAVLACHGHGPGKDQAVGLAHTDAWALREGVILKRLDVLADHPLVDPGRLGMVGLSYGGTVTLCTAALDQRVAAAVVSGFFSSWAESHKMPWNMCGSQVAYGMLGRLEHEDLGALIAPRPLLIETGTQDPLFPLAAATESVRRTRLVYDAQGAGDRLEHSIFEGDHQWHGADAVPFLARWLDHPA